MDDRLTHALTEIAESAPHDPDLARAVRRRADRRTPRLLVPLVAAAAVLAVVVGGVLVGRPADGPPVATPTAAASTGRSDPCRPTTTGVLPVWARGGFTAPYRARYATSTSGDVLAILFVDLRQPQVEGTANKVLWVSRDPVGSPVTVDGHRLDSDDTMRATLASGFGPSYVDVPAAGCWRLTLRWTGGSDRIDLAYAGRPDAVAG